MKKKISENNLSALPHWVPLQQHAASKAKVLPSNRVTAWSRLTYDDKVGLALVVNSGLKISSK